MIHFDVFISEYLSTQPKSPTIWIGMRNDRTDGMNWIDKSPVTFTNWKDGEPSVGIEECVGKLLLSKIIQLLNS